MTRHQKWVTHDPRRTVCGNTIGETGWTLSW